MKKFFSVLMFFSLAMMLTSCGEKEPGRGDPELKIVPGKDILFDKDGGSEKITVETNLSSWSAKSDQTWCAVTEGEGYFTVSAAPNALVEAMPEAVVTVTAKEGSDEVTKTFKVNQTGTAPFLFIDPSGPLEFPAAGGTIVITVDTNLDS